MSRDVGWVSPVPVPGTVEGRRWWAGQGEPQTGKHTWQLLGSAAPHPTPRPAALMCWAGPRDPHCSGCGQAGSPPPPPATWGPPFPQLPGRKGKVRGWGAPWRLELGLPAVCCGRGLGVCDTQVLAGSGNAQVRAPAWAGRSRGVGGPGWAEEPACLPAALPGHRVQAGGGCQGSFP